MHNLGICDERSNNGPKSLVAIADIWLNKFCSLTLINSMLKLIFISLFALLLKPTASHACGTKSEYASTQESKTDKEKMDCCNSYQAQCGHSGQDSEGKCEGSECHCPVSHPNYLIPKAIYFSGIKFGYIKPTFHFQSGFYALIPLSIWLPPKIG